MPLFQRRAFVHRDVVGFVASDLILRMIIRRMMRVPLIFNVVFVNLVILPLACPASEFQVT